MNKKFRNCVVELIGGHRLNDTQVVCQCGKLGMASDQVPPLPYCLKVEAVPINFGRPLVKAKRLPL